MSKKSKQANTINESDLSTSSTSSGSSSTSSSSSFKTSSPNTLYTEQRVQYPGRHHSTSISELGHHSSPMHSPNNNTNPLNIFSDVLMKQQKKQAESECHSSNNLEHLFYNQFHQSHQVDTDLTESNNNIFFGNKQIPTRFGLMNNQKAFEAAVSAAVNPFHSTSQDMSMQANLAAAMHASILSQNPFFNPSRMMLMPPPPAPSQHPLALSHPATSTSPNSYHQSELSVSLSRQFPFFSFNSSSSSPSPLLSSTMSSTQSSFVSSKSTSPVNNKYNSSSSSSKSSESSLSEALANSSYSVKYMSKSPLSSPTSCSLLQPNSVSPQPTHNPSEIVIGSLNDQWNLIAPPYTLTLSTLTNLYQVLLALDCLEHRIDCLIQIKCFLYSVKSDLNFNARL